MLVVVVQIIIVQVKYIFGLDVVWYNGYYKMIKVSFVNLKIIICDFLNIIFRKKLYYNYVFIFLLQNFIKKIVNNIIKILGFFLKELFCRY